MRILLIAAWCPLPADNGARIRAWNLLRALAEAHRVDLLAFAPEPRHQAAEARLRELCADVELIPRDPFAASPLGQWLGLLHPWPRSVVATFQPEMAAAVRRRLERRYDLVVASCLAAARYATAVPRVPRILDDLELGSQVDQLERANTLLLKARYKLSLVKARRYLADTLRHFHAVIVASAREQRLVRSCCPATTRLEVVPNGADLTSPSAPLPLPLADLLVYAGSLRYGPNLEAVRWFARKVLPIVRGVRPGARLRVTGARASGVDLADVEQTGYLDDVRPAVASAWAEVVPLLSGSGTRLKVLEAMALGTPVVSTSKGVEGLEVEPGRDLLVADGAAAFADATSRLLGDPALRARLSSAGRALVHARYDWKASQRAWRDIAEVAAGPSIVSVGEA